VFYWIYDYPTLNIGALFAFVFVAVTWLAIFFFRRFFRSWIHGERRANDMVGFALSSFSVLYGLLVGLLAVAAYQNFSTVDDIVTKEASSLGALYGDLGGYPQPIRGRLQGELRDYTRNVIDVSWPAQRQGIVPSEGTHRVTQFVDDILRFKPTDKSTEIVHAEAFRQLNNLVEFRRARLANVTTGIPAVFWWVVGIGAFISILLVAMLDMEIHVHLILGSALSLFLGLVIFLIAAMDNPFRGEVSVGPDAFQLVYETVMKPTEIVDKSMAALIATTGKLGSPKLEGTDPVGGKSAPGLYFGATKMNNSFDVVDEVVKENGGTATFFVRAGDEYIRVATNLKKDDGSRAIGTILDPNGPAIDAITKGEAYYGEATILGKPYVTGYEPIKDGSDNVIGIYYVGYRAGDITGAGATFPYPIYAKWSDAYRKDTGNGLNYQAIGSSGGVKQIEAKTITFGATDKPLDHKELNANGLIQFPMVIGGIVPVVNLEGVAPGELVLDGPTLAKVFMGEITKWDDPAIKKLNEKAKLPSTAIAVVHRSDGSGTTFNFTNYLAKVSPDWKSKVGSDTTVEWPTGVGAKGNEGVANKVTQTTGSIGYVEYAYAKQKKLTYADMVNKDGKIVAPDMKSFQAAAVNADWKSVPGFAVILTDQPGADSWPIDADTFILMHENPTDAAASGDALKFFGWAYKHGDKMAEELDYIPMPDNVVELVHAEWKKIKDSSGEPVFAMN